MPQLLTFAALAALAVTTPLLLWQRSRPAARWLLPACALLLGAGVTWTQSRSDLARRQDSGAAYRALRGALGHPAAHRLLDLDRLAPQHGPDAAAPAPDTPDVVVYRLDLGTVPRAQRAEVVRQRTMLLFPADITILLGLGDAEQMRLQARLLGRASVSRVGFATVIDRSGSHAIDADAAADSPLGPIQVLSLTHLGSGVVSELVLLELDEDVSSERWAAALPALLPEGRRRLIWAPHVAASLPDGTLELPQAQGFHFEGGAACDVSQDASLGLPPYPDKDPALLPARDWLVGRAGAFWSAQGLYDAQNVFCRSSARQVPTQPRIVLFTR